MSKMAQAAAPTSGDARLAGLDWARIEADLDAQGFAVTGHLFDADDCAALRNLYGRKDGFRKQVIMARHGYGRGEYKYFDYPLPEPIATLRAALYPPLAIVANRWAKALREEQRYPDGLEDYLARCHAAGQTKPTPLLLQYGPGDYNCLHRDLYGDLVFPLQLAVLLSAPGEDFEGGEFVLVEQRPRAQSVVRVVPLRQGEGVIFAVNQRPQQGPRGFRRLYQRHGVSEIRAGDRYTLGVIFHDAA